nr:solute carrier family 25 member 46 [Ciona intestinalis]|eukprot:XP_026692241.1 solute carrier family 25 member 46 [Ciona intestinalis]
MRSSERRRKKELNHGPSYNRLHGAPPSARLRASASSPSFSGTRPRVRFDEGPHEVRTIDSQQQPKSTFVNFFGDHRAPSSDVELEEVMRHYGINDADSNNIPSSSPLPKPTPSNEHNQRLASVAVSVSSGLGNFLLAFPCQVLRRQCQINHVGRKYHLTPFTIISVAANLQRAQGVTCLWKGIGSSLWLNAIEISSESIVSEVSSGKLPKDVGSNASIKRLSSHLVLKLISSVLVSPFFSAHLVESVQSEITSETPGIFSCLTDGVFRLFGVGRVQSPLLVPFRRLILPTVLYSLLRYVLSASLQQLVLYLMRLHSRRQHEKRLARLQPRSPVFQTEEPLINPAITPDRNSPSSLLTEHYPELVSGFVADMISDIMLYPMETVLHRLHIQGTRTIIDNTDTGRGFMPVSSRHEGFFDCWSTTVTHEGYMGLYRGFGALTMQYSLRYAVLRLTKLILQVASGC